MHVEKVYRLFAPTQFHKYLQTEEVKLNAPIVEEIGFYIFFCAKNLRQVSVCKLYFWIKRLEVESSY